MCVDRANSAQVVLGEMARYHLVLDSFVDDGREGINMQALLQIPHRTKTDPVKRRGVAVDPSRALSCLRCSVVWPRLDC
jgi:hypothetical protein